MKRPQLNGNKLVTRYSDTTSLALRNYIDISSQRLSKVRAGKHLVAILQKDTPTHLRRHHQTPDLPRLDDPLSLNGFSSHRSEKPATAGAKQIVLSDFMGTYLTQKNIDEDLLAKKEDNIYQFFKEKFGLMGKYLGEDVLKAGLAGKGSSQEGERAKKYKNVEYDAREHGGQKNEEKTAGEGGDPASRIMNINREIMGIILKEEHAKEMDALMQLQTEQNMQVFNDLQDIGFKDNERRVSSVAPTRTSPTKMILKNNFLRTFVEIIPESPTKTEEKFYSTGTAYRSNKKKISAYGNRPQTDYLVFRTQQKKEIMIPDIERISSQFDSHKYGKKAAAGVHHTKNVPSTGGVESMTTEEDNNNAGKFIDKLKVPRALSFSKLETPQPSMESVRNLKARVDTGNTKENYSTAKSIKALIGEEIEFLNNNRDPNRQRASTAAEKVRIPSRFVKQVTQIDNKHALLQENIQQETEPGVQKEASLSHRDIQTRESKRPVLQDTKKNVPLVSKSQTRMGAAFEESNQQLQGIRIMKKNATYVSPKTTDNSFKFAVQTPVVKSFGSLKKEVKSVVSSSQQLKTKQDLNSLLEINSEKPVAFTTKFKTGKKDDLYLPENDAMLSTQQFTGTSSGKTNSKAFVFDQRSGSGSNLLMKASFGNKYWKNTFND